LAFSQGGRESEAIRYRECLYEKKNISWEGQLPNMVLTLLEGRASGDPALSNRTVALAGTECNEKSDPLEKEARNKKRGKPLKTKGVENASDGPGKRGEYGESCLKWNQRDASGRFKPSVRQPIEKKDCGKKHRGKRRISKEERGC